MELNDGNTHNNTEKRNAVDNAKRARRKSRVARRAKYGNKYGMSKERQQYFKERIFVLVAFVCFEVTDLLVDWTGYIAYIVSSKESENLDDIDSVYGITYSIFTVIASISSVYILKTKILSIMEYRAALKHGIYSKSHDIQMKRNAATRKSKILPQPSSTLKIPNASSFKFKKPKMKRVDPSIYQVESEQAAAASQSDFDYNYESEHKSQIVEGTLEATCSDTVDTTTNNSPRKSSLEKDNSSTYLNSFAEYAPAEQDESPTAVPRIPTAVPRRLGDGEMYVDGNNLELFIHQSELQIRHYHALLTSAFFEDFLTLILAVYRHYRMVYYIQQYRKFFECLEFTAFWSCSSDHFGVFLLDLQIVFSLGACIYKLGFYRDLKTKRHEVKLKKLELMSFLKDQESVLDSFAGVSPKEVQKVISVRHLLGEAVNESPPHVTGDVNILRHLQFNRLDEFKTFTKMKEMLDLRRKKSFDSLYEVMIREDFHLTKLMAMFLNNFMYLPERDEKHGNLVSLGYVFRMEWKKHMDQKYGIAKFEDVLLQGLEYESMIVDKLSRTENRVIRITRIWVLSTTKANSKLSELLQSLKYGIHSSYLIDTYYPKTITSVMYGIDSTLATFMDLYMKATKTTLAVYRRGDTTKLTNRGISINAMPKAIGGNLVTGPSSDPFCTDGTITKPKPLSFWLGQFSELQFFSDVSEKELTAVFELKALLGEMLQGHPEYTVGDITLLRHLRRTANLDVPRAARWVMSKLEWRKENGLDAIRQDILSRGLEFSKLPNFEIIQKCVEHNYWLGEDKQHNVITMSFFSSRIDFELLKTIPMNDYMTYQTYALELMAMLLERHSLKQKRVCSYQYIFSMKGATITVAKNFKSLIPHMRVFEQLLFYHPVCPKLYMTGLSSVVSNIVNATFSIFSAHTKERIVVVPNKKAGEELLLSFIDASVLPRSLGGNNTGLFPDGSVDEDCLQVRDYSNIIQKLYS